MIFSRQSDFIATSAMTNQESKVICSTSDLQQFIKVQENKARIERL